MKIIEEVCDTIEHELRRAEKYLDCAILKKEEYPALADTYYKLSEERMKDQELLHTQVVALIESYKKTNGEVPERMQPIYDYLHRKFISWATEIKVKQNLYKSNT